MDNDKISLCVSVITPNGDRQLYRIADVIEGILCPFNVDSSIQQVGENVAMIFHPDTSITPEGSIDFWKWYSLGGTHQWSCRYNVKWVEYIQLNEIKSLAELRIVLFNGVDSAYINEHDYLIEFSRNSDNVCTCAYCKSSNLLYKNNQFTLNDNVYFLDIYEISSDDIGEIRALGFKKLYYKHMSLPQKSQRVLVRTPAETVRQAIIKRISKCTEGLSKSEKAVIANFIRGGFDDNILDNIIAECRCTREEAKLYLDEFTQNSEQYFTADDFASQLLLRLVDSDNTTALKYKQAVRSEWELDNAGTIQVAHEKLDEVENQCKAFDKQRTKLYDEIEQLEMLKAEVQSNLSALQCEYDDKLKMADGITTRIRERIEGAKKDLVEFFADYAVFAPNSIQQEARGLGMNIVKGVLIDDKPDIVTPENVLESLKDNLRNVGVAKSACKVLGAYLLGAYSLKIPLIVAGYGASAIVDALSASLFNRTSDRIYVKGNSFNIDCTDDNGIVVVYDGLGAIHKILDTAQSRYFCFITQTFEELIIEPRSLYNYGLPLCAEYFITNKREDTGLLGSVFEGELDIEGKERKTNLPTWTVPELSRKRIEELAGAATTLYDDLRDFDITAFDDTGYARAVQADGIAGGNIIFSVKRR